LAAIQQDRHLPGSPVSAGRVRSSLDDIPFRWNAIELDLILGIYVPRPGLFLDGLAIFKLAQAVRTQGLVSRMQR
jgi:hypothetical protein